MQREIQDAAYRYQREVEDHARIVVGVNEFVTDEPPPGNLFQIDAAVGEALAERVRRRAPRAIARPVGRTLDALESGARGRANLHAADGGPRSRPSARSGEICDRLRAVFGVHQPSVAI